MNGNTYKTIIYKPAVEGVPQTFFQLWHSFDLAQMWADAMLDKGKYTGALIETYDANSRLIERIGTVTY